jgi:hypothetical protein
MIIILAKIIHQIIMDQINDVLESRFSTWGTRTPGGKRVA